MKRNMKWILIGIGAFCLVTAIAALIFWRIAQKNIKDKGGMENPYYTREDISSAGEDSADNI